MKRAYTLMLTIAAVLAYSESSFALTCNKTFTCTNGDWETQSCWDAGVKCLAADTCCVPSGRTATVNTVDGDCAGFDIDGTVIIKAGRALIMHQALQDNGLDGEIRLERGATAGASGGNLKFEGNLKVLPSAGNDGLITGLSSGSGNPGALLDVGELEIAGGGTRATAVVVQGLLDVEVKVNNNGYVVANNGTLTLKTNLKRGTTGNGKWIAEGAANKLIVNAEVIGGSDWELVDNASAVIQFTTACVGTSGSFSGDFTIKKGILDIDANVDTTGNLIFESVSGSHPRIDVANTKYVEFGQ